MLINMPDDLTNQIQMEETMLIKYACKQMGLNCTYMVKGETVEEVVTKALEHVRENHAGDFKNIQSPEEIQQMEKALARSTYVVTG